MFKEFIFLNLNQFENIGLNFPIGAFVLFASVAMCVSLFAFHYHKSYTTAFIKGLLRHEAVGDKKGVSLKKLHLDGSYFLKLTLSRKSGPITHITARVGAKEISYEEHLEKIKEKGYKEEKIDFESALFYIRDDMVDAARAEADKHDSSWLKPIIISVIILAITVVLSIYLKDILGFINNLV